MCRHIKKCERVISQRIESLSGNAKEGKINWGWKPLGTQKGRRRRRGVRIHSKERKWPAKSNKIAKHHIIIIAAVLLVKGGENCISFSWLVSRYLKIAKNVSLLKTLTWILETVLDQLYLWRLALKDIKMLSKWSWQRCKIRLFGLIFVHCEFLSIFE